MAQPHSLTPGAQSPNEASPLLINGPPPSSFTAQSPAPDDMSSPRSSDPLQGPPSQPPQTSEDIQRSKTADRLTGALGITYDVAKIVAGNFPLPGLQSMIGLFDYIRALREAKKSNDQTLEYLDTVVDDIRNALNRSAGLTPAKVEGTETNPFGELLSKLDEVSGMLKQRLEEKTIDAYLDVKAIQGDITSAHDRIRDALSAYLVTSVYRIENVLRSVKTDEKLKQLPMARAAFDQSPKAHCLSGTRADIIKELLSDLKDSPSRFVWLKGSPGRGKSAIAKSICIELRTDKVPVASFFFNKDGSQAHTSSAERFPSTIARQLARISDEFGEELAKLDLEESSQNFSKEERLEQLVISPANKVAWSSRVVLVLDALDECGDRDALRELVGLVGLLQRLPPTFAIFVSCRPVDIVEDFFRDISPSPKHLSLDDTSATEDMRIFVRRSFSDIKSSGENWPPSVNKMDDFADACGGLFEIASVRIRQVCDDSVPHIEAFNFFLSSQDPAPSLKKEYRRILRSAYTDKLMSGEGHELHQRAYQRYRRIVSVLITVFERMSPQSLASLVGMEVDQIRVTLKHLSPVMETRGDNELFQFYHASFGEFLLLKDDPTSGSYPVCFGGARHIATLELCLRNIRNSVYGRENWHAHLKATMADEAGSIPALLQSFVENGLFEWLESVDSSDAQRALDAAQEWCNRNDHVESMGHVKQILKDASGLNSAGDPDPNTFSAPPRNLLQFRLGWLPPSNWFRQKYEQEAQITVISVDKDGSPTHGGQDPFEKSSTSLPCLTVISPEGFFFAVANSDGKLDIRRAVTGEKHGKVLHCRHIPDNHQVVWMYFLDESRLVAEYKCGSIHNHRLEEHSSHEDPDAVHSLPVMQSSSSVFSSCSLDRSTILRLTKLENSDQGGRDGPESARAGDQFDGLLVYPGEPLSAYTINCRSWNDPPFALPSPNVSEECVLDPGSLAISRNNEYAAAVLIERDGSQHDSRRHVHLWSIPGRRYLGRRELRGPRWESWIPANYFNCVGDHHFLARQRDDDAQSIKLDLVIDVYHPNDVRLREDSRPQQTFPKEDCVFFVAHGRQIPPSPCSTSATTFMCNILGSDGQSGEFLRRFEFGLTSRRALAFCIREFVRKLEATFRGTPLDTLGTLDRAAVALNRLAARDVAKAVRDVAKTARDAAKTARDVATAANDVADAANIIADALGHVADAADDFFIPSPLPISIRHHIRSLSLCQIQCSDIFAYEEVFRIPHHLVIPILVNANLKSQLHHRSGGSRVVLGGYTHPFDEDKWIPICVLDFQRLLAPKH